jgi:Domain of unknown function (DUF4148)
MKMLLQVAVCLAVVASTSVFAQGKTRAEVYQELVDAQHNGLDYVTDTSYPDVNPMFAPQVARMERQHVAQAKAAEGNATN